ncbi:cell envelope integrity protein TolA [Vibrio superstes]|nr:cell envelope integrity protein TolA [Vibrio superstes]
MKQDKKFTRSLIISAAVHLLLVIALIWGTNFNMSKPEPTPNMVEAVVIDPNAIQKQAQQIRQQREAASKAEQERIRKLKEQSKQLEKNRKAEEERIRRLAQEKAESEKKTREAEKQRQLKEKQRKEEEQRTKVAEAERKKKEQATKKAEAERLAKLKAAEEASKKAAKAEADRVAKEKAAKEATEKARKAEQEKLAQEKAAKEAAEKAKKEQARLAQLERERKEQEAALSDIFSGLEAEQQTNSTARSRAITDEVTRMGEIYKQMIQRELLLDDSFRGKECRVNLRLLNTGSNFIVSDLRTLSGDSGLCRAAQVAVSKVGSFPLPSDKAAIDKLKSINLTVAP